MEVTSTFSRSYGQVEIARKHYRVPQDPPAARLKIRIVKILATFSPAQTSFVISRSKDLFFSELQTSSGMKQPL
jgi:hypothetical protein